MYDRVHQEQIVAGMTVQHRDENPGCARTCDRPRNSSSSYCGADTRKNVDISGLVNPQFSIPAVEASAPQVVVSRPPLEEFDVPVYDHIHQGHIVSGETTLNVVEMQEQVIVQEIPQISIVERIQAPQIADSLPLLEDFAATVLPHVIFSRNSTGSSCGADKGTNCLAHRSASA